MTGRYLRRHLLREHKVEPVRRALIEAESLNEYRNYADAYRGAGSKLAGDRSHGGKWDLPIISLYRHAIELMIKAILTELGPQLGVNQKAVLKRSHRLDEQMPDLEMVAKQWGLELTQDFKEFIDAWNKEEEDFKGLVARYPETQKGDAKPLKYLDAFDLEAFVDECESVLDELTELHEEPDSQFYIDLTNKMGLTDPQ